ncbi:acyl-CoA N-acyltransferase [Pilobolus umbonatus]|nr:acyl-CoA N-acyltransferase [Pilobolus umbonatus]
MSTGKRAVLDKSNDPHIRKKTKSVPNVESKIIEDEKKTKTRGCTPPIADPSFIPEPNVDTVIYGSYEIKAWYYSPYPYDFGPRIDRLYICDQCLRYMNKETQLIKHKLECKMKRVPGRLLYAKDTIKVYEIDGQLQKSYCQNLCLMAKLFLDNKTLYFDTEGFKFYVLTEQNAKYKSKECMVGYFSKEKVSYDNYNLACIMTLPSHQRKGYGRLLIELSYELSKHEGKIGSPEKPLSPLGSLGYQSYWASTILATLIHFKGDVTIGEVCKETCIHEEDAIDTLYRLNLLRYRKVNTETSIQNICITEDMLRDAMDDFNIKLDRKLDLKNIKWK